MPPHTGPKYSPRNRPASNGSPSSVQRSYASQLKERDALFTTYEHLQGLDRGDEALKMLRRIASIVKPIMQKHNWRVQVLAEFLPTEAILLGMNINRGSKILVRLRYHRNPDLFLPLEEVVDTMLHELCHNIWGEHDSNFHKLWEELREEHEVLVRKGYTGEGFLSEGRRLGGSGSRVPPPNELRRLARAGAEKRKSEGVLSAGSGQKLGGKPLHMQGDIRSIIAEQAIRRNTIDRGCASGRQDAGQLSEQSANNTFKTKAEEDDANNRAIVQALYELMEQEEEQKLNGTFKEAPGQGGLGWDARKGLYDASTSVARPEERMMSEEDQLKWAMEESMRSADLASSDQRPFQMPSAPPVSMDSASGPAQQPTDLPPTKRKRPSDHTSPSTNTLLPDPTDPPTIIDLDSLPDPPPTDQWACEICTCINPITFLSCDACGVERRQLVQPKAQPKAKQGLTSRIKPEPGTGRVRGTEIEAPKPKAGLGWKCQCGAFMEHKWWTCSACGEMKTSS